MFSSDDCCSRAESTVLQYPVAVQGAHWRDPATAIRFVFTAVLSFCRSSALRLSPPRFIRIVSNAPESTDELLKIQMVNRIVSAVIYLSNAPDER